MSVPISKPKTGEPLKVFAPLDFDDVADPVEVFTRGTEPRRGGTRRLTFGDRAPCIRDRAAWASLERNVPSAP